MSLINSDHINYLMIKNYKPSKGGFEFLKVKIYSFDSLIERLQGLQMRFEETLKVEDYYIVSRRNAELTKLVASLESQIQLLQNYLRSKDEQIVCLLHQRDELNTKKEQLNARLNHYSLVRDRLQEQFLMIRKSIKSSQERYNISQREVNNSKDKNDQLSKQLQDVKEQNNQLHLLIEQQKTKNDIMDQEVESLREQISKVKVQSIEKAFRFYGLARQVEAQNINSNIDHSINWKLPDIFQQNQTHKHKIKTKTLTKRNKVTNRE